MLPPARRPEPLPLGDQLGQERRAPRDKTTAATINAEAGTSIVQFIPSKDLSAAA